MKSVVTLLCSPVVLLGALAHAAGGTVKIYNWTAYIGPTTLDEVVMPSNHRPMTREWIDIKRAGR